MTLEELMKENADILRRMKEEDDRYAIRRLAHEWWNLDIVPPKEYHYAVSEYFKNHQEEFRGAVPM